jgi:biotin operon repressor
MNNPTRDQLVLEEIKTHPGTPKKTLARILCKKHPKYFQSLEKARSAIRYRTGANGKDALGKLADRTLVRAGSPADRPTEKDDTEAHAPEPLDRQVLRLLARNLKKKQAVSAIDLANELDRSPNAIAEALEALKTQGVNVAVNPEEKLELATTIEKQAPVRLNTDDYFGDNWVRFGLVADTHLASKYERLDVLNALYDVFEREGIKTVYHGGNWIDGEARFNKYDLHCIGVENQIAYFLKHYPQRKGITTQIVSGDDHEGWYVQREQINIGKTLESRARESGREDIIDLGYMERDIVFERDEGSSIIRIIHAGGGSAYAISYTSQKYVESLQGGEKPAIVCVGHFHKYDHSYPREVHVIQAGCTEDQTPFMRKRRIQAMVGGVIVEAKQDKRGCFVRVRVEWMPFYDKKFYSYKW